MTSPRWFRGFILYKKTLVFSSVTQNDSRKAAYFRVTSKVDIQTVIDIFTQSPLNTTKHLNFLAFKQAFNLYTKSKTKSEVIEEIDNIQSIMNSQRVDHDINAIDPSHQISITPNWLLEFVEAEGSFLVAKRQYTLIFSITQSVKEELLMKNIKIFLNNIPSLQTKNTI